MEFGDNGEEDWAGLCHYEEPIRIEIDKSVWEEWTDAKNEQDKEYIIFHELGHGFLNREHRDDLLKYGDWASIMRGGDDKPDSRKSWNINYRGFRRDYYVDELFDPNTPAPNWANLQPVFYDNPDANIVFSDNFSSNINDWWVGIKDDKKAEFGNGYYKIQTTQKNGYYWANNITLDKTKDFYIELNIKFIPQGNNGDWHNAGLVWGGSEGDNLYYLSYTKDKRITIGNYINYVWYIELPCPSLKENDFNKIVIRKIKDIFYLSINGNFIYHTDYDGFFGDLIGFELDGNSTIWVDKFQVSYLGTASNKSLKGTKISEATFIGLTPEIKNQHKIDY